MEKAQLGKTRFYRTLPLRRFRVRAPLQSGQTTHANAAQLSSALSNAVHQQPRRT
jgi:hypothetical protein